MTGAYWMGRRVALTGATGFLGRRLVADLRAEGATVVALVRSSSRVDCLQDAGIVVREISLDKPDELTKALEGCSLVFHVAGAVDFGDDWERLRQVNVQGTINVAEAARRAGAERLIYTSSIVAVGASARRQVLDETATWNLGSLNVPYVTTKRQAEEAVLARAGRGIDVVVVNPGCIVGPNDVNSSEFGLLCRRFWKGSVPLYFSGGNNFVDVRDVAEGHLLAARFGRSGERYFLGGENLAYRDFFQKLARICGRPVPRFQLPAGAAPFFAWLEATLKRKRKRPLLSLARARLMGRYFFATSAKAERELGYRARPVLESLTDAYRFWHPARAA